MILVVPDCFYSLSALEAAGEFMPPILEGDRLAFLASGVDVFLDKFPWAEFAKDEYGFINNLCYVFKGVKSSMRRIHIYDNHKKMFTGEVREIVDSVDFPYGGETKEFYTSAYSVTPCGQLEWRIEAASFELHIPERNISFKADLPHGAKWIEGTFLGG